MIELGFAVFFTAWVALDADVLAPIRTPVLEWLENRTVSNSRPIAALATYISNGATCHVCLGFWLSLAISAAFTKSAWGEIIAANGFHLLLVAAQAYLKWSAATLQTAARVRQNRVPA